MEKKEFKIKIGEKELTVEIRNLAEQANGEILVSFGQTMVLATAVMSKEEREEVSFLPLTVEYQERYYAAGKILGSRYIRREGRPSEEAILTSRLIDRTIRPRFPENFSREIQVIITCLSWDRENDPDFPALIAASLALSPSDIPFGGPIAALRIGKIGDHFLLNPDYEKREESGFDLFLSGLESKGEILINMIEFEGEEVKEEEILKAIEWAKPYLKKLLDFQKEIIKKIGKEKIKIEVPSQDPVLEKEIKDFLKNKLEKAIFQPKKRERAEGLEKLKEDLLDFIEENYPGQGKKKLAKILFEKEVRKILEEKIIVKEERPDNRKPHQFREIQAEVGLLPRTHGSALFCRGETKALSILTLGTPGDQKLLEGMEIIGKKRFMHHYNFPPYSVGEIKPLRGPARRDIGHGMLVEKALLPLIPSFEKFPYTMRVVSEILSSNGSTSMASVSSSCLSLMDAGVPIKEAAAGIAIGLFKNEETKKYKILTDIQGPEDSYGDMDLKVAGTKQGITAIQMDVKTVGINEKILKEGLEQAREARLKILEKIKEVLSKPREKLSPYAPKILTLKIEPEKIGEVIGPKGKVINEIIAECQVAIDIQDSGLIYVTSESEESAKKAISWIKNITRTVKVGEVFQGKVKRILNFGAMIEILPGQEGLLHISELSPKRIKRVEEMVKIGDLISVQVISIDNQGRINLSLKKSESFGKKYAQKDR
ncbi:MAG: polyribonucleotide nucleotidyltransferase [Candidatus Nealsonbacteria bacterium CG03_land_8_20_14_0_80_36_12]|uniref:Polyribonucleotide nucleotidyltransferase n=1 Tax=Candidatus Nealsonbacteria bacterium CG03_land_8_20_14_0_80_36_12 TaxID=1974701 RepID=A0A2M7BYG7_9BACT|nr:MAG: polyribonucleotide nucleotidyltransferase [Candidatus Nealsonbacteria bacterium CG03_land_8_20_14_0_80_36_12]